jgi:NADH-quinone oxidoreductase subunit M
VYLGLYEQMPSLAAFFLLTGLASVGFPGTVGFVGAELLVESAVSVYPLVGTLVVLAGALNGIAVLHAYFRLFTGCEYGAGVSLSARWPERVAVLTLTALIIGGGLVPQPGVRSRYHAATELLKRRHPTAPARTTASLAKRALPGARERTPPRDSMCEDPGTIQARVPGSAVRAPADAHRMK